MNTTKFTRKVDGKEFRDHINDIAGGRIDKIYYIDGYDDAIIGYVDSDNDTIPHIVYDYDLMLEVAFRDCQSQEENAGLSDDDIMDYAASMVDDAINSICARNGIPPDGKEPMIMEPIKSVFIAEE